MEGWFEWNAPCEKPVESPLREVFEKELRREALGPVGVESEGCMASKCGGRTNPSRALVERTAVMEYYSVRCLSYRTRANIKTCTRDGAVEAAVAANYSGIEAGWKAGV